MNKSTSVFNINDINIASNTNFTFTFTAAQQINYSNGVVLGDMTDETIRFSVSTDGSSYAPVALKVKKVASGYWYLCTAEFKLPAGVSTDKIWVRFDGYAGLNNHGLRIDDFKLYEGGNGSELVVPSVDYTKGTVAEAIAAGAGKNYEVAATVVAMHTQGILIGDASGVMLAFLGEAPAVAVNDAVTVKGTTELRNGVIQFGKEGLSVAKTGTGSYNTPAPEVMDGTAVTAYIATALENKAVYKYVKYNGEFTVSGNYYNVVIVGTTTKGSVAYGKSEWASFNGKPVTVEGWLLGGTANYLQTMATSVTVDSSTPIVEISAPQQFAATSPVAQTLNYTVTNTTASAVTFAIEGTNADKFSLGAKTDNTIVVSAKGNNTDKTAYTANLVAKVAGATVATVALKQAAPASGDEGPAYLWTLASGDMTTAGGTVTKGEPAMEWTSSAVGYIGWDQNYGKGVQFGSSKKPVNGTYTLSTTAYSGKIAKIVINASVGSGGDGKLTVKVGGTQIGEITTLVLNATDYTFTPSSPVSGNITIELTNTVKAMYLKSIAINPAE